ncbi:hypothetical protein [Clostridium perfringens]|nr:hypothetical protein [Clostridium perfringens]
MRNIKLLIFKLDSKGVIQGAILNIILIPKFSSIGADLATLIAE